uniref:Uncharacterized protein n=1 Tax=Arundo donax TaxID=35708 RepID=A0A0A8YCF3_ARUDO
MRKYFIHGWSNIFCLLYLLTFISSSTIVKISEFTCISRFTLN